MKGVVLETNDKKALVLREDGSVVRILNRRYLPGAEIDLPSAPMRHLYRIAALAASFILFFTVTLYAYYTPAAYISIDVNPSIELTLNAFSRVIHVQAMDEASQQVTDALHLHNRNLHEAIALTLTQMDAQSVFAKNERNYLVVSVAAKNQMRAQDILDRVVETVAASSADANLDIEVQHSLISLEYVRRAQDLGTTPGKLRLIQMLRESSEDPGSINDNDWIDKPVREIMQQIHTNQPDWQNESPDEEGGPEKPMNPGGNKENNSPPPTQDIPKQDPSQDEETPPVSEDADSSGFGKKNNPSNSPGE